jgi:hypothetical protein
VPQAVGEEQGMGALRHRLAEVSLHQAQLALRPSAILRAACKCTVAVLDPGTAGRQSPHSFSVEARSDRYLSAGAEKAPPTGMVRVMSPAYRLAGFSAEIAEQQDRPPLSTLPWSWLCRYMPVDGQGSPDKTNRLRAKAAMPSARPASSCSLTAWLSRPASPPGASRRVTVQGLFHFRHLLGALVSALAHHGLDERNGSLFPLLLKRNAKPLLESGTYCGSDRAAENGRSGRRP